MTRRRLTLTLIFVGSCITFGLRATPASADTGGPLLDPGVWLFILLVVGLVVLAISAAAVALITHMGRKRRRLASDDPSSAGSEDASDETRR